MEEQDQHQDHPPVSRVITCKPENQRDMAAAVKAWPELHSLVKGLQAQGTFPGLRGLRIKLTGSKEFVAQGLGAIGQINASKAE